MECLTSEHFEAGLNKGKLMRNLNGQTSKADGAGFDYYLKEVEKRREESGNTIQLSLLRLLAREGQEMELMAAPEVNAPIEAQSKSS